ncbi:MAG TPA: metal ABC transporter ATP-binding protein [Opitutaceae bacterium]|nr:metal ABC transporter ATP-binding protein [Opitutaceae bacterium]
MPAATHNILRFRDVTVCYGRTPALQQVTLDIPCGSSTAILGRNGAGKTTLLRAILGWHPLASGEIRLGDAHPQHLLPRLAYLPQRQSIDWDFPITVRAVVEQGRFPSLKLFQRMGARDHAIVDRALDELGITEFAGRQIRMLSGGQQQRVFLARALAQGADIFLLDEPFAGLDLFATEELSHILRAWETQGRTVLASMHDLELARRVFTQGVLLDTKLIASGPIAGVLSPENIDRAYRQGRCVHDNPLHLARTTEFPQ